MRADSEISAETTADIPKINAAIRFTPSLPADGLKQLYRQYGVPASALSHAGGSQIVWTLAPGGRLRPVPIRVGITDYTFTQLLSGEVQVGDELVTGEAVGGENTGAAAPPKFGAPRR